MVYSEKQYKEMEETFKKQISQLKKENELKDKEVRILKKQNKQKNEIIKDLDKYDYCSQYQSLKLENEELKKN